MALDLTMQITADASQAKAELRSVEQGIQKVEGASTKATPSIAKVTDAVSGTGRELSKVEQAFTKHTGAMDASQKMASRLSGATLDTNKALGMLSGGAEGAATQLLEMVGAGGLSVAMLTGLVAGASVAVGAITALGMALAKSVQYYVEHSEASKGLRAELDRLSDTWNDIQFTIGAAVLSGEQAPLIAIFRLAEDAAVQFGAKVARDILLMRQLIDLMPGMSVTRGLITGTDTGDLPDPSKILGGGHPLGSNFGWANGQLSGALDLTSGSQAQALFDKDEAERKRVAAERLRLSQRANEAEQRRLDAIDRAFNSGPGYRLGVSGQIGETVGAPRAPFDPSGMLDYRLGLSGNLPEAVSVPTMLAGVLRGPSTMDRVLGGLGGDVSRTLQRFLIERSSGGSAIGASVGGSIFGSLMEGESGKAIGSALSGALGSTFGGAVGSFIPFGGQILGSLVGKLLGGLFSETQGHKDLMAGNKDIDAMKAALGSQFGGAAGARTAGSIFGVDIAGAWNSQNLAGAEHFKGLVAELDEKQATFNDSLGGTLEKIRDLGGNTSDALRPYLQSLTDAKVLTSDNLALIAKLSGENTVDFGKMEEAAKRYGISVDSLGQAFKDDKMHKSWQQIIDDLDLLQRGGADMNGVLSGMQDEIQDLVTQSIQFGTTIPSNMKPWIQQLIDSGKLLGATGEKIEDISQLSFGDTMQTSLEKLNDTLQELIETLSVGLPKAAQTGADGVSSAFSGGPGGGGGGGGTGVHVHVNIDGREAAEAIVPHIPGVLETRGV